MAQSSLLKAQVARDLLQKDFLDRLDSLDASVRKLQIGAVENRAAASSIFPGVASVGGQPKIVADGAGNVYLGSNAGQAAGTHLSVFAKDGTYNSESVGAGDLLIGDNSANKANILWDKSAGQLKIRGGGTTEVYIDTNGSLTAGGGAVRLDSDGISLRHNTDALPPAHPTKALKWGTTISDYGRIMLTYADLGPSDYRLTQQLLVSTSYSSWSSPIGIDIEHNTSAGDTITLDVPEVLLTGSITDSTAIGCRATRTTARTGLSWGTWYNVTPASDTATGCFDTDGMWQSGWDYLLVNTPGIYAVGCHIGSQYSNATGHHNVVLSLNANTIAQDWRGRAGWDNVVLNTIVKCAAADKLYAKYYFGSGSGSVGVSSATSMWAVRIA